MNLVIEQDLLRHDRFPSIWMPDPATRDLRALLTHRMRLVRIRTMVKNGLHAIALNSRLACGTKLPRQAGLAQLQALTLPPHTARRRDPSICRSSRRSVFVLRTTMARIFVASPTSSVCPRRCMRA